jgi:L-asparaginase
MAIRILVTGGTFDKEYNLLTGQLLFNNTHIPEMLRLGRSRLEVNIQTLMMIDSLSMTDADRQRIVQECKNCAEDKILITHGTDTMEATAQLLGRTITNKTIVLTGAMVPYAFGSSDGLFNLGSALAFLQVLQPGVYISMNGKCFPWYNVRKNKEIGLFEERTQYTNETPLMIWNLSNKENKHLGNTRTTLV